MLVVPLMPIMFLAPQRLIESRSFKLAVGTLLGALLGLATLVLAIDVFFFGEFGGRLDHKVFNYLPGPGNEYVLRVIFDQFPVIPALAGVVVLTVGIGGRIIRVGFDDRYNTGSPWHAIGWPTRFAGGG